MEEKLRMYILVKEGIPSGKAVVGIAHASLACYLKYQDTEAIQEWLNGPFYKIVCRVSSADFERAKALAPDHITITESSLDQAETVLAFRPRAEYPKAFKYYARYK
jgi:peptidyl-tRNA hydrolase